MRQWFPTWSLGPSKGSINLRGCDFKGRKESGEINCCLKNICSVHDGFQEMCVHVAHQCQCRSHWWGQLQVEWNSSSGGRLWPSRRRAGSKSLCPGWEGSAPVSPARLRVPEVCGSWRDGRLRPITFSTERMIRRGLPSSLAVAAVHQMVMDGGGEGGAAVGGAETRHHSLRQVAVPQLPAGGVPSAGLSWCSAPTWGPGWWCKWRTPQCWLNDGSYDFKLWYYGTFS